MQTNESKLLVKMYYRTNCTRCPPVQTVVRVQNVLGTNCPPVQTVRVQNVLGTNCPKTKCSGQIVRVQNYCPGTNCPRPLRNVLTGEFNDGCRYGMYSEGLQVEVGVEVCSLASVLHNHFATEATAMQSTLYGTSMRSAEGSVLHHHYRSPGGVTSERQCRASCTGP